jgi:hypothetical protein
MRPRAASPACRPPAAGRPENPQKLFKLDRHTGLEPESWFFFGCPISVTPARAWVTEKNMRSPSDLLELLAGLFQHRPHLGPRRQIAARPEPLAGLAL